MSDRLYIVAKWRPHNFPSEIEVFATRQAALAWIDDQGGDTSTGEAFTIPAGEHEKFDGTEFNFSLYEREVMSDE